MIFPLIMKYEAYSYLTTCTALLFDTILSISTNLADMFWALTIFKNEYQFFFSKIVKNGQNFKPMTNRLRVVGGIGGWGWICPPPHY